MATFVVEDGTGKPDATSFADVAFADQYFALRGNVAWVGSEEEKQAWLVQATDYISNRFTFRGMQLTDTQALPFPRTGTGYNPLPVNLLKATCEYAVRAKVAPLAPDPEVDSTGRAVAGRVTKVGPIETSTTYSTQGSSGNLMTLRPYPAADMLLRALVVRKTLRVIR